MGCAQRLALRRGKKTPLLHEEAIGRDAHGGMVMKATPTASFEMPQAEFLLEFLIVALDDPALFGQQNQTTKRDGCRQIGQPVLCRLLLLPRPFDQQPLLGMRFFAPYVTMSNADPQAGKARVHGAAGAFAPTDAPQIAGAETEGKVLHRQRLMVLIPAQQLRRSSGRLPCFGRKRSCARRPYRGGRLDAHGIRHFQLLQFLPKAMIVAIGSVGQHHATLDTLLAERTNLIESDRLFGLKSDFFRYSRLLAAVRIARPV